MTLRLHTFGAVYLERDRVPLGGAHTQRRRLALLAYLAASNRIVVTRDKLIGMLWPESDEAGGRHSLSQLLYALRHDLDPDTLRIDQETVSLNPAMLESDVHAFDLALRAGLLEQAVEEYSGPFLDGFHIDDAPEMERWIESERSHRETQCARALEKLAATAEEKGDRHRAHEWWHRRAAIDPTDGRVTLNLMKSLVAIGDREGAIRAARVYETLMREELETEPDRAVSQFAVDLRASSGSSNNTPLSVAAPLPMPVGEIGDAPRAEEIVPVQDVAVATTDAPPLPKRNKRRWWPAIAAGAAVIVAVFAWRWTVSPRSDRASSAQAAVVVLGDLSGPDSVLSLAVREALRAQLANTSGVLVTSDLGIRELETLMRLPKAPLRPPHLLTVAARGGAQAAIAGSVVPIGAGAQIVVDVLDPHSGRVKRTFAERPLDAAAILTSIERMGRALGAMISKSPRDTSIRALPAVTTASLPALKSYALARQMSARGLRPEALEHGERAVYYDSTFVLAHYLLADLLWFLDEQRHSDAHLTKAFELSHTVPLREQLVIRARYEQLVRDRPDSALVYWDLLRDASPGDALAYEGRTWALRALGRHEEAAAAADSAMHLDPSAVAPNTNNAMYSWLAVGDTASALALAQRVSSRNREAMPEARFYAALQRRDLRAALAVADSSAFLSPRALRRQLVHIAAGNFAGSRANLDSLKAANMAQFKPRALLNQGWAELALRNDRVVAGQYAREVLAWLRNRDLSPPAIARLSERTGDLAARSGDEATVLAVIDLVRERDRGRSLRSYVLAQRTLDASLAYVRGDYPLAARRAEAARHGVYFWRSLLTIVQLEADARRAAGEFAVADSLKHLIATHQIVDSDFETWSVLRTVIARRRE